MATTDLARRADAAERLRAVVRLLQRHGCAQPSGGVPEAFVGELEAIAEELQDEQDTQRRQGQRLEEMYHEVQAERLRYQELFDFAPNGYLVTDAHGVIQEANHAAASLLGMRRDFLVGKPLPFFVQPAGRADFYNRLGLLTAASAPEQWETRLVPRFGEVRHVFLTVTAIPGAQGRPAGFRWLLQDMTPRRRAEEAFRAQKDFADSLVDTVEAIVLVLDAQGRIVRSNRYLHDSAGCTPYELNGRDWCDLFFAEADRPRARRIVREALVSGTNKGAVLDLVTRSGRRRAVAWSVRSLEEGPGGGGVVLLGQDVTDLQEAQRRALQAERLATVGQMAAGLAHESRNALQRTQACLSILNLRLRDQPEALALLQRIQKAQDDLHQLFNEVGEYSAPLVLERRLCDLAGVWREAWADLGPPRPGVTAELREEVGATDLRCAASPFHLKQVFRNIFDNAVSEGGASPRVVIHCDDAEIAGEPAVRVSVRDNGPGFKPEQREKAFQLFFTTKVHGTGLGLAICKRIVDAHGGRIEVGRAARPGAEILITLPRRTS
jgi:PAS domain S-box-containing protein